MPHVRIGVLLTLLLIAGLGLYQMSGFWSPIYQYRVGTPRDRND